MINKIEIFEHFPTLSRKQIISGMVEEIIIKRKIFDTENIDMNESFQDFDSLDRLELAVHVEDEFKVEISDAMAQKYFTSGSQIVKYLMLRQVHLNTD